MNDNWKGSEFVSKYLRSKHHCLQWMFSMRRRIRMKNAWKWISIVSISFRIDGRSSALPTRCCNHNCCVEHCMPFYSYCRFYAVVNNFPSFVRTFCTDCYSFLSTTFQNLSFLLILLPLSYAIVCKVHLLQKLQSITSVHQKMIIFQVSIHGYTASKNEAEANLDIRFHASLISLFWANFSHFSTRGFWRCHVRVRAVHVCACVYVSVCPSVRLLFLPR